MNIRMRNKATMLIVAMMVITATSTMLKADTGMCGGGSTTLPFTDVLGSNIFFCAIAEAYVTGLTNGTSAATYGPTEAVTREQMAAFISRTMDQSLKRGSRRAPLDQYWTPSSSDDLSLTSVGNSPTSVKSDGADLWVANNGADTVSRVRAGDGKRLETWTGATKAFSVLAAKGLIFVTGDTNPGSLYRIDPTQPAGAVTKLPISLGASSRGISFDGARIWTANFGGSVSIVTLNPLSVITVTAGFSSPFGTLYDGAHMWVTDFGADKVFKLDSNGAIIQAVTVGTRPAFPVFDGTNIWVPNQDSSSNSVTVIRASTGAVLATLTGNGLVNPTAGAFDGERVLFTGDNASLWKAADLSPLGSVSLGGSSVSYGACSDGLNFWITIINAGKLARF